MALALAALAVAFPARLAPSLLLAEVRGFRLVRDVYSVDFRLSAKGADYTTQISEVRFLAIDPKKFLLVEPETQEPRRTLLVVPKSRFPLPFKVASGRSVKKTVSFRYSCGFPRDLAIEFTVAGKCVFDTEETGSTERISLSPVRYRKRGY